MYKFYWSNLQKSQSGGNGGGASMQSQNQPFVNASSSSSSSHHQSRSEQEQVWTRQIPAASTTTTTTMPESSRFGSNPEPLPARSGRATTVRVTSPNGDRDPSSSSRHNSSHNNTSHNKLENKSGHTPTGSHRVLLKLRRGAQAARPKSVHGAEQVMASCEQYNKCDRFNMSADDTPSILETLANLRTGDVPAKSTKRVGMPNSKSMHHFYSRTWTEKTLQRYQHNYENVYSNGDNANDNNNDNPVYENIYFRHGCDFVDNNSLVIGQMAQSPRSAARMRHKQHQQQSATDFRRQFEPPPEPTRSVPPVPPERKGRGTPKGSSSVGHPKPLYRSKSCERPKMKDAMRDTFRISSDKIQNNFSRLSSNLTDKLSNNVMHRFSGGGCGAGSVSSSSRMSTGSTDVSSTTSHVESPNSLLQTVALRAIPCVDIQSHGSLSGGSEDGAQNLDYDNQADEEYHRRPSGSSSATRPTQSLASRMRDIRQDVQKRFSRLRSRSAERLSQRNVATDRLNASTSSTTDNQNSSSDDVLDDTYDEEATPTAARPTWTPSYQCSIPRSFSGLPTTTTSSAELYNGPFVARARALVDCTPSPYDREALRFKRGDLIDVISMNPSGLWRGRCESRIGHFKFITVELLADRPSRERRRELRQNKFSESEKEEEKSLADIVTFSGRPETVEELLKQIGLEDHISVFVLNGYEELESFAELDESELDYLGIHEVRKRSIIMAAVEWLQDTMSASTPNVELEDDDDSSSRMAPPLGDDFKPFRRLSFPRDSGCFASSENLHRSSPAASDRSFHSGSQTESGIHLTHEDEVDDVDGDVDEGDVADVDVSKKQIKRPAEQVTKTKALRDRHTLTARDLGDIPALIDSGNVANTNNVDSKKVVPTSSKNDVCDKNFAALVEKYSTNERVTMEGKFLTARSVFESTNVSGNAPTTSTKATFRPSS